MCCEFSANMLHILNCFCSSTQTLSVGVLTEADVLSLIRVLLPPFNIMLQKLGDLFCGEPMVTLKVLRLHQIRLIFVLHSTLSSYFSTSFQVAGALWFLARAGSMMNMWTLTRMG